MGRTLTDITLIVDRSGSMASIRDDAEGGINTFIEGQRSMESDAYLTLVEFDSSYHFVHRAVPMSDVGPYNLVPRGSTALLDAVGRAIDETDARIAGLSETERPGLVIMVIITDGQENSSTEFSRSEIRRMIERQQRLGWQFTFLAADASAFSEGASIGINEGHSARYDKEKTRQVWEFTNNKVRRMRVQLDVGAAIDNQYTSEELEAMS